jgi:hypothetical protein
VGLLGCGHRGSVKEAIGVVAFIGKSAKKQQSFVGKNVTIECYFVGKSCNFVTLNE